MKKILVVIDMQNDFIDGSLGTREAKGIVDKVCMKICEGGWDLIVTTQDTHDEHYLKTQEGKKLPIKHCIEGTEGWYLNHSVFKEVAEKRQWCVVFKYNTFGAYDLMERIYDEKYEDFSAVEIHIVGVCTDICVITNALLLKTYFPEARIVVDASCCAGSTPLKHDEALDVMRSCQIDIVNDNGMFDCVKY